MVPRILNSIFGLIQRKNNDEYNKLVGVWTPSTKLEVFFCAIYRVKFVKSGDIIILVMARQTLDLIIICTAGHLAKSKQFVQRKVLP